jgi:hypothetical protein
VAIGDLDESVVSTLESVLFGTDDAMPEIQAGEAAVLIEVIKDMVCQCYIRTAKLRAALKMRNRTGVSLRARVDPVASIRKKFLPRRILAPACWMPGVLHRAKHALRVRHHDRDAPVFIRQPRNAAR